MVAFLVDHDDFDRDGIASSGAVVLDCRRALKGPRVQHL